MKFLRSLASAWLTLNILAPLAVLAASTPAYQAEYEVTSASGKSIYKYAYDGAGHGRCEVTGQSGTRISVIDVPNQRITMMVPGTKESMTIAITEADIQKMGDFGQKVKASGVNIGTKVIGKYFCEGTKYSLDGGISQEIWTSKSIGGGRVFSKVVDPQFGITESQLKSYSLSVPKL